MTPVEPLEVREWAAIDGEKASYRFRLLTSLAKPTSMAEKEIPNFISIRENPVFLILRHRTEIWGTFK